MFHGSNCTFHHPSYNDIRLFSFCCFLSLYMLPSAKLVLYQMIIFCQFCPLGSLLIHVLSCTEKHCLLKKEHLWGKQGQAWQPEEAFPRSYLVDWFHASQQPALHQCIGISVIRSQLSQGAQELHGHSSAPKSRPFPLRNAPSQHCWKNMWCQ